MRQLKTTMAAGLLAAGLAAGLPAAASASGPLYVTGAILNASTDIDVQADFERLIDDDDEGWSFGIGFHISEHLAIEGTYHDLGTAEELSICSDPEVLCTALVAPAEVDSTAIAISVLPHWPLTEHFSLYGRLGIATWESDVTEAFAGTSLAKLDDEEYILGVGVRFEVLGPFGAFAEVSRIADTFETVSLGATLGY
ncbi:MAG: porin family protein [bacterium]|nr:porin family protein [bacterium]